MRSTSPSTSPTQAECMSPVDSAEEEQQLLQQQQQQQQKQHEVTFEKKAERYDNNNNNNNDTQHGNESAGLYQDHFYPISSNYDDEDEESEEEDEEEGEEEILESPRRLPQELEVQPQTFDYRIEGINGHYEVSKECLGTGASGKVILARDRRTNKKVAVKIVPKAGMKSRDEIRIRREYAVMMHVNHPNILRLREVVENPSEIYLVMQYCPKGDLLQMLQKEKVFSESKARGLFKQVAEAVAHLHRSGWIHRDIKPENILLSNRGRCVLGDFGYSVMWSHTSKAYASVGSLYYASPEIVRQNSTYIGPEVDVWSLGCVLFAMTCGYLPFYDENVTATKRLILRGQPTFKTKLSESLNDLLLGMLDPDATSRLNMEEVLKHEWVMGKKKLSPQGSPRLRLKIQRLWNGKTNDVSAKNNSSGSTPTRKRSSSTGAPRHCTSSERPGETKKRERAATADRIDRIPLQELCATHPQQSTRVAHKDSGRSHHRE